MKQIKLVLLFALFFSASNIFGATISGKVIDAANQNPIVGANLELFGNPMNDKIVTVTDGLGNFIFENVPADWYLMNVTAIGYYDNLIDSLVIVDDNTVIDNLIIEMIPVDGSGDANLSGLVFYKDENGVQVPIPDANVFIVEENWWDFYSATSDENGNYSFTGIPSGTYLLWGEADGYELPEDININLADGDNTYNLQMTKFVPPVSGTVSGTVTFDQTGEFVEHAFVSLMPLSFDPGNWFQDLWTETDENGNYSIEAPVGEYYVIVEFFDGMQDDSLMFPYMEIYDDTQNYEDATVIEITENQETTNINFGIPEIQLYQLTISGAVNDEDGNPVPQAFVEIYPSDETIMWWWGDYAMTDENGNYSLTTTIPSFVNSFVASAQADGYINEFYDNKQDPYSADVLSASGENDTTFTDIDFSLEAFNPGDLYSINGSVKNEEGNPVDAFITAIGIDNPYMVCGMTDSSGVYSISDVPGGTYVVFFEAFDYAPQFYNGVVDWEDATPVSVKSDVTNIDAVLVPLDGNGNSPGKVTGYVMDDANNPIPGVMVAALDEAGNVVNYSMTKADGSYQVKGLANGDYDILATKVKFNSDTKPIEMDLNDDLSNQANFKLNSVVTDVNDDSDEIIPSAYSLKQNYPNPFNPSTEITFTLPENQFVNLVVYNLLGEKVQTLVNKEMTAGSYNITFNAKNLNSGVYFYSIKAGNFSKTMKMILMK